MTYRQPRIRVSGMIWDADDRLLLVCQGRRESPRWMLPGGGVEAGESLTVALERELREEIGMTSCRMRDPVALIESIAPEGSGSNRHLVHIVFAVECSDGFTDELQSHDPAVHELRMTRREELLGIPLHPPIGSWLAAWRSGAHFAYFGPLWAP